MAVKDKYNHSISLSQDSDKRLRELQAKGYSIRQLLELGMDTIKETPKKAKKEAEKIEPIHQVVMETEKGF